MKYLTKEQLQSSLSLGKPVEQWMSYEHLAEYVVLKWLRIDKEGDSLYNVSYIECFDEGDINFIDIYSFSPLDPDDPYIVNGFNTYQEAINFAINFYSASETKFVSRGMVQEEYKAYITNLF